MRKQNLVSVPLAIRFMLLLAFAMLSLSVVFFTLLRLSVTKKQDDDLQESLALMRASIEENGTEELAFLALPYYISYSVYEEESKAVLATNDSLLPLLDSKGKSRAYFEKDFFTDSDLSIRYRTQSLVLDGKNLIAECAIDVANDSAAKMLSALPALASLSLLPILLISFALSFLISRETIAAFEKLREDYNRERAFTSNVSHELKTPISIIDGHANLLKRWGKDDPERLAESIDVILRETENMNAIVTTLLDISRLENGKITVQKERFFITNFFKDLTTEFRAIYPEIQFAVSDPDFLEIETDAQKLHQIFTVIVSNSVKFAGKDCRIRLSAKKTGARIRLAAEDNGSGFSEETLPHVFERFYKGDSSHNRNVPGSGLGLSIAKTLAESLGLSIEAKNAPGGGAVICLTM